MKNVKFKYTGFTLAGFILKCKLDYAEILVQKIIAFNNNGKSLLIVINQKYVCVASRANIAISIHINPVIAIKNRLYLVRTTRFWNNLHKVRSKSKDWKAK